MLTSSRTMKFFIGDTKSYIGRNLAFPGTMTRMENLTINGRRAALMVIGGVVMFLVAGLLEGFARQLITDTPTRLTIAAVMLAFWLAYFTLAGQREDRHGPDGPAPQ